MPRKQKVESTATPVAEGTTPVEATPSTEGPAEKAPEIHVPPIPSGSSIIITPLDHPRLNEWVPEPSDIKFSYINEEVYANFDDLLQGHYPNINTFKIVKKHYKERMDDVCKHINYFIKFYDYDNGYMLSILSMKYLVDLNVDMTPKEFRKLIMTRVVTKQYVDGMKQMARDLYTVNINTDNDGKYSSTPKITNDHAKQILAVSFAIRGILPLCVHFSNIDNNIITSSDYISCFDKIFMKLVKRFEENDAPVLFPLYRFVEYRLERAYNVDARIWEMKQQLYGTTFETVFQNMIHEVLLVKSIYKIAYDRSVVSYIDGVVTNSYNHFRFENFKFKPIEIDAEASGSDSDDYLTHAESIEMSIYRIDESNQMVNDVNSRKVLKDIYSKFNYPITQEELDYYYDNCKLNNLSQYFLHLFFSGFFHNSTAIQTINRRDTIHLLVILKYYMKASGMVVLPNIVTAIVRGRFKENTIKNAKLTEMLETSSIYKEVILPKYKYLMAVSSKENPILKKLSTILNSTFILVDTDPQLNGREMYDLPIHIVMDEFMSFLAIV